MRCCLQRTDLPELVSMSRENMAGIIPPSWGEGKDEKLLELCWTRGWRPPSGGR